MKKILTTIFLIAAMVLSANAQCHCNQQHVCSNQQHVCSSFNRNIYNEVINLIGVMEKTYCVECMEGMETYGGEIILKKERNRILITHKELKSMIEYQLTNPHRRFYNDINTIRTELYMYNVELLKYINKKLYYNRNIKNIYIVTDQIPGASYVCIEYYRL